jgi:hypothetical protein
MSKNVYDRHRFNPPLTVKVKMKMDKISRNGKIMFEGNSGTT